MSIVDQQEVANAAAERRRQDKIAAATVNGEQARLNKLADEEIRANRQAAADERAARLAKQARTDKTAERKAKQQARAERKAARAETLTPGNVYRLGTLILVIASALGSLPAQIVHFASISPMLLPLPLSIEGAAWVFAAGVAFADARKLPGWVRWLLRGFILASAGFAASINYSYGHGLAGLSDSQATTAGVGLAAVSLLGPLMFEIRQWVATLSEKTGTAEDKARRKHAKQRRKNDKTVYKLAERLMSRAAYNSLTFEDAWTKACAITYGTAQPGMTPKLARQEVASHTEYRAASQPTDDELRSRIRTGFAPIDWTYPTVSDDVPAQDTNTQVGSHPSPSSKAAPKGPRTTPTPPRRTKGDSAPFSNVAKAAQSRETKERLATAAASDGTARKTVRSRVK